MRSFFFSSGNKRKGKKSKHLVLALRESCRELIGLLFLKERVEALAILLRLEATRVSPLYPSACFYLFFFSCNFISVTKESPKYL